MSLYALKFKADQLPEPIENYSRNDNRIVQWGLNNQYPYFLLNLYQNSPIHSSVVNQKVNFILGAGIDSKSKKDISKYKVNPSDSLYEFLNKIVTDLIIYGAYSVEVIFNRLGKPVQFYHIPMHRIRLYKSKNKFVYREDWILNTDRIEYDRYFPNKNTDTSSKIFYFDTYYSSRFSTYPTPEYRGCLQPIATDVEIRKFNFNNVANSFSPSKLISFFRGDNIDDEELEETYRQIEQQYSGSDGKRFLIEFINSQTGKAAEIKDISIGDFTNAYQATLEQNTKDILLGHGADAGLFGIQEAGKLGNVQELETSYAMFKANYVQDKRNMVLNSIKELFLEFSEIPQDIEFIDKQLFNVSLSDDLKKSIYTINELRKEIGLAPLSNGDRLINDVQVSSTATTTQMSNEPVEEKPTHKKLGVDDYKLVQDMGISSEDFELEEISDKDHFSFSVESDISELLISKDFNNLTYEEIAQVMKTEHKLNVSKEEVKSVIDKLEKSGLIKVDSTSNRLKITPNPQPNIPDNNKVTVMYKYEKRKNIDGEPIISTTRDFCRLMIQNNKLYSRQDIQKMTEIFGYPVYELGGGWYYNPKTDKTTPFCRHEFVAYRVRKKN